MRGHNEMYKNIIIGILVGLLSVACAGFGIQTYRLGIYRQQSEYYRTELAEATNREQQLAATIDECWRSTERTSEILSQSINSVGELREQIRQVREAYQDLENRLLDCYDRIHNNDDITN